MSKETVEKAAQYKVTFTFTTFDTRRSMATGRNGSIVINSSVPYDKIDREEVKQLCVDEMYRLKPNWSIILLEIADVSPVSSKKRSPSTPK